MQTSQTSKNKIIIYISLFAIGYFCLFSCCLNKKPQALIALKERMNHNFTIHNEQDIIHFFPTNSDEIIAQKDSVIEQTEAILNQIQNIMRKDRTFTNTAQAFDTAQALFARGSAPIYALLYVSPNKDIRDTCCQCVNDFSNAVIDLFNNPKIYQAFKEYIDDMPARNEALSEEQQYFLQEIMKGFVKSGCTLPQERLDRVKEIQKELAILEVTFEQNIAADKSSLLVTKDELAGLSEDFINTLPMANSVETQKKSQQSHALNMQQEQDATKQSTQEETIYGKDRHKKQYILTCDYPTYFEIIENCSIESTRKQLYLLFNNRAYPQNTEILQKIITLRAQLAHELGFASFAHMDIDGDMAQTPVLVDTFLHQLRNTIEPKVQTELSELTKNVPTGVTLNQDGTIKPWDVRYIINEYKKNHYHIDERTIAEYFPVEKTINNIFAIYQQFLGLSFTISTPKHLWHPDVQCITVHNKQSELLGYILLDLYPRADKFSHACQMGLIAAVEKRDEQSGKTIHQPSLALIIANFPKSTTDKPALLKHADVVTFFHEFGHAMHHLLSKTTLTSCAGTATKRDFVEVPSQMFEQWMWDTNILKTYSNHYKTGDHLPDELIEAKIQIRNLARSFGINGQIINSLVSLKLFDKNSDKNIDETIANIYHEYSIGVVYEPQTHMHCSFGHLMGYGSKYYSYLWSLVHAMDLFDYIKEHGLLNTIVGEKLTHDILSKGGSAEPSILLENFLGRPSNQDALIKELLS